MNSTAIPAPKIDLSAILESKEAELALQKLPVPASFTFVWHNRRFRGELDHLENGGGGDLTLTIRADLGPLPFSAEDPHGRRNMLEFAGHSDAGPWGHQRISKKKRLEYAVKTRLTGPVLGGDIMTAAVVVLLQSAPYFEHAKAALPVEHVAGPKVFAAERNSLFLH